MTSIDSINGMTHTEATKLRRARVRTTVTFLQIASTRSGRALLTKETGITSPKLLHWAKRAELMKIKNLGRDYADLLEAAGIDTLEEGMPVEFEIGENRGKENAINIKKK